MNITLTKILDLSTLVFPENISWLAKFHASWVPILSTRLRWFFEKKVGRRKNGQVLTYGYMHKEYLEKRIWAKNPMARKLAHFNCQGEAMSIWTSLGNDFWPGNWKSMGKSYILSIFYKKNFLGCLWFLGLYLVENVHFWAILTKTCFCPHHQHKWPQMVPNSI